MKSLKLSAKIFGAVLLIPAVATAAFFLAPFVITHIGFTLFTVAAGLVLAAAIFSVIGLIKSAVASFSKKDEVISEDLEKEAPEKALDANRSPRMLGQVQSLQAGPPQPLAVQSLPENPAADLSTEDFTHIASEYVYEEILFFDENDFEEKFNQALQACQINTTEVKYIYIKNRDNHAFALELRNNEPPHLWYSQDGAGDASFVRSAVKCSSSSLKDNKFFENLQHQIPAGQGLRNK